MKNVHSIRKDAMHMDDVITLCGGVPRGDELPQVAGEKDILMDVYSDILNMPREEAAGFINHQYEDESFLDNSGMIH